MKAEGTNENGKTPAPTEVGASAVGLGVTPTDVDMKILHGLRVLAAGNENARKLVVVLEGLNSARYELHWGRRLMANNMLDLAEESFRIADEILENMQGLVESLILEYVKKGEK